MTVQEAILYIENQTCMFDGGDDNISYIFYGIDPTDGQAKDVCSIVRATSGEDGISYKFSGMDDNWQMQSLILWADAAYIEKHPDDTVLLNDSGSTLSEAVEYVLTGLGFKPSAMDFSRAKDMPTLMGSGFMVPGVSELCDGPADGTKVEMTVTATDHTGIHELVK